MGIFTSIMDKIFYHGVATVATPQPAPAPAPAPTAAPMPSAQPVASPVAAAPQQQPVDVGAVLADMAEKKGGGGNYQTSIVDLLKLLDLDSSLTARKQLGDELNVHVGADGTAEENIALHKAVMQKLEDNGGQVPSTLKD